MIKDCTTCKYEPDWGPLQGRNSEKRYRSGICKFGPLPPVYPVQTANPIYKFSDRVGLPGACKAWRVKDPRTVENLARVCGEKEVSFELCYDDGPGTYTAFITSSAQSECWSGRPHGDVSDAIETAIKYVRGL